MDLRRAAGALLALAACIATATAAPTVSGNHTALDLYDGHTEGCYYNFRHYSEGDRIMTNEPCLNCTCHNRMLMCYLRVCPFTKAIGQDCTVEKRADQCCPIVTCPDVPVDLLTSTSTSSPAEYGSTGVGKLDVYGCTINGKYLPEGAKVPQSPGKPCEHCYCIRNMTTCVMQECTLHVDGCTPIYAKDVCCPIRYFCDHPEEMPALDDMTTTVRPTPGFLLTTITTEEPTTLPAKRDCIEDDQMYPDGALIKTEKPCEHCYCMKGDIVCVVQECGTPMENEGKNCTSLPPREGQCCPDTYICEGDEVATEAPSEEFTTVPPRRSGVEGSGYRHDDELPYTEVPTNEIEGSGEEETATGRPSETLKPETGITEANIPQSLSTTSTPISQDIDKETTEPDKGLNTVPSDEEITESSYVEKTTSSEDTKVTELPSVPSEDTNETTESSIEEKTTSHDVKITEAVLVQDIATVPSDNEVESSEPPFDRTTEPNIEPDIEPVSSETPEKITAEPSIEHETTKQPTTEPTYESKATEPSIVDVKSSTIREDITEESSQPTFEEEPKTTELPIRKETEPSRISEITTAQVTVLREGTTKPIVTAEETTPTIKDMEESPEPEATVAPGDEQDITTSKVSDESTESSVTVKTTLEEESKIPDFSTDTERHPEIPLVTTIKEGAATSETIFRKTETTEATIQNATQEPVTSKYEPSSVETIAPTLGYEAESTTAQPQQDLEGSAPPKESTTESVTELSTFAHVAEKESPATHSTEKLDVFETTTLNPEENEIGEELPHLSSPDHIPGEGDCLLNGITYSNNSVVPSTNKCHSGCKCFSSIIKCDPIMCSPQPDYMDNCQVTYDTPDSCCPTYVCDHSKETIPPQPHSQMSETESPTIATGIECQGNECEITEEKQPTAQSQTPETCGLEGCTTAEQPVQIPTKEQPEQCSGEGCDIPATICTDEKCVVPPIKEQPQSCDSPDQCKQVKVPELQGLPCDGESCAIDKEQPQPCEGEGCDSKPVDVVPQVCVNEEECKQSKVPETGKPPCDGEEGVCDQPQQIPCEGEHCEQKPKVPKDEKLPETAVPSCEGDFCVPSSGECAGGKCTETTDQSQTSEQGEVCSEESGCKKPEDEICHDENCKQQKPEQLPTVCDGSDCILSVPVVSSEETTPTFVKEPVTEQDHGVQTELPELQTVSDVKVTKTPERTGATAGPEEPITSVPKVSDLTTEQPEPQIVEVEPKLPEPTVEGSGMGPEVLEIPTEKYPEPSVTIIPQKGDEELVPPVTDDISDGQKVTVTPAPEYDGKIQTELPESTSSAVKDEIPQEHVTQAPEVETTTNLQESLGTNVEDEDTRPHEEPIPSVTSTSVDDQARTELPEQAQDETATALPQSPGVSAPQDETPTASEYPATSAPHDETPTESESQATIAPQDETPTVLSQPITSMPHEEYHTELPESPVTNIPEDGFKTELPESIDTKEPGYETATELSKPVTDILLDEIPTELPESPVTQTEEEKRTELPESPVTQTVEETRTELPGSPVTQTEEQTRPEQPESPVTQAEEETRTELPGSLVTQTVEQTHPEPPESPVTQAEEETPTELTESPVIQAEKATSTELPESPVIQTEEEMRTELPQSPVTQAEEETRTELPGSPVTQTEEQTRPEQPESPVTQAEEETRTELPGSLVTQTEEQTRPELPESPVTQAEEETRTELPGSPVTQTEEQTRPEQPESPVTQAEEETRTELPGSLVTQTEEQTRPELPESPVTQAEEETRTELPGSPVTQTEEQTRPEQPESPVTQAEEETRTELPGSLVTQTEEQTRLELPESSVTQAEEETRTELPGSPETQTEEQTRPELPESPVTQAEEETRTELPGSPETQTEEQTRPELPESPVTQAEEETRTELPGSPVKQTEEEMRTELPGLPVTKVSQDESPTEIYEQGHDATSTELPELAVITVTSVPQDETRTQLPELLETSKPQEETQTEVPQPPVTSEAQEDKETATGPPQEKTELPESTVTSTPLDKTRTERPDSLITSIPHDDIHTELPESPITNAPYDGSHTEVPGTSEMPETEKIPEEETHTLLPVHPVTGTPEDEIATEQPESLKPSTPLDDIKPTQRKPEPDEAHTESQEIPITSTSEVEKQTTIPEYSVVQTGSSPELPESPITSLPQDVTTEAIVKSTEPEKEVMPEISEVTKEPGLPTETDTDELITKVPKPEAEEPVTTDGEQQVQPGELITQVPEKEKPEEEIDTTTKSEIAAVPETEEKESTESPKPDVTSALEEETQATEQVPEQPEEDTQPKEPSSPAIQDEYITSVPVSITDEGKIHTESPLSLVTIQQPYATTSEPHISGHEETDTTEYVLKEDHEKTEKPEIQSITKKPDLRQPEVLPTPVITESPAQQQEVATEKESIMKETPAVDEKQTTEMPVASVTSMGQPEKEETPKKESIPLETEEPYVPTVPSIQSEDTTTKAAEESSITEIPEKGSQTIVTEQIPVQQETVTHVPVSPDEIILPTTDEEAQHKETTPTVVVSEGPATPSLESATEAQTQNQEKVTESAPEILTEPPQQITSEKSGYEEIATKAPESEEPIDTKAPEEQTESPTATPQLHDMKVEYPEQQPTKESETLATEQSSMITPSKEYDTKHEEPQTEVPTYTSTNLPEFSEANIVVDTRPYDETEPSVTDIKTTEPTPAEETVSPLEISTKLPIPESPEDITKLPEEPQTASPEQEYSETTPYLVELEEHTHKIEAEPSSAAPSEEPTTARTELHDTEVPEIGKEPSPTDEIPTDAPLKATDTPSLEEEVLIPSKPTILEETPERATTTSEAIAETTTSIVDKFGSEEAGLITRTQEKEQTTPVTPTETEKPFSPQDTSAPEQELTVKPIEVGVETTAPEEEFIPAKATTSKIEIEPTTLSPLFDKFTKPDETPGVVPASEPETPSEPHPTDEVPSPEDETHFPPSGGYGQEPDYGEEDQAFGPGTCRYGGKVYVSAQQIPRDDPCDFCFCFRSDIICLQQSCPPPIHGCHEEPIQGFCCPRYECPVAMATTLNVTTTTTTTTTTLPPHFLPHAYKGAAQRRGCQVKGHTYKVGEVVRASSGPCLHCTCGGDGQMKCDPKACTPEPMLRQMIAAAVSSKRRR